MADGRPPGNVPLRAGCRTATVTTLVNGNEECFRRAKGEAGLADYQVRTWIAWHHHQTLSLLAAWFLNKETREGKKKDPGSDDSATTTIDQRTDRRLLANEPSGFASSPQHPLVAAQRTSKVLQLSFA